MQNRSNTVLAVSTSPKSKLNRRRELAPLTWPNFLERDTRAFAVKSGTCKLTTSAPQKIMAHFKLGMGHSSVAVGGGVMPLNHCVTSLKLSSRLLLCTCSKPEFSSRGVYHSTTWTNVNLRNRSASHFSIFVAQTNSA